jgi:alkanesulfonate monooxygenase SsuD/methylene tetrahydromethanopterin reductase-like flavin-dependent oxidoreductase (luciferase family)
VPDYGHDLLFGSFLTPVSDQPQQAVALAQQAERAGLDLVTFSDHPYQPGFLDTWTLLSYAAARTSRVRLSANVLNLPLRQPAVIARSAASLDLLTGGRAELGLGAGAYWDAIEAMGGRRLAPGQAVKALAEAIEIIRGVWDPGERAVLRAGGEFYRVHGAKRGPAPAHDIGIWLGAYRPRMLALTGRAADGWLPSLGYLKPADLAAGNEIIDEAATAGGRQPGDVRRLLNIIGTAGPDGEEVLPGKLEQWPEILAGLALRDGISAFLLGSDDPSVIQRFGQVVAPAVRELVEAERRQGAGPRSGPGAQRTAGVRPADVGPAEVVQPADVVKPADVARPAAAVPEALGLTPTPDTGQRLSTARPWDEASRPAAPQPPPGTGYSRRGRAAGRHLIDIHDHLRSELGQVRDLIGQVRAGAVDAAGARSAINEMTMRQNDWTLGAYCASYCRVVTGHHTLEDEAIFPHLRASEPGLAPVIDRLAGEHKVIHQVLDDLDTALVALLRDPADFTPLQQAADLLTDTMLSHLAYEEAQLVEPLARHGFYAGQL